MSKLQRKMKFATVGGHHTIMTIETTSTSELWIYTKGKSCPGFRFEISDLSDKTSTKFSSWTCGELSFTLLVWRWRPWRWRYLCCCSRERQVHALKWRIGADYFLPTMTSTSRHFFPPLNTNVIAIHYKDMESIHALSSLPTIRR